MFIFIKTFKVIKAFLLSQDFIFTLIFFLKNQILNLRPKPPPWMTFKFTFLFISVSKFIGSRRAIQERACG